jgi:hypothetical protein
VRWRTFTVPPGYDGGAVWCTPAIDAATGRVYVGTGNAYHAPSADTTDAVLALDSATGQILSRYQAQSGDIFGADNPTGPDADFGASPNLIQGPGAQALVGAGAKDGAYYAVARSSFNLAWRTSIGPGGAAGGFIGSTVYDGARIYGSDALTSQVAAMDRGGSLQWSSLDGGTLDFSPLAMGNGVLYTANQPGFLTARDPGTGTVLMRIPLGGATFGGISVTGGAVYAAVGLGPPPSPAPQQTGSGSIVAFGDTSRSGAASSGHPGHLRAGQVITLPRGRSCRRRSLTIRLRHPRGVTLRKATVYVNGRRVRVITRGLGTRRRITIHSLGSGVLRVRIVVRTSTGRKLTSRRTYPGCR